MSEWVEFMVQMAYRNEELQQNGSRDIRMMFKKSDIQRFGQHPVDENRTLLLTSDKGNFELLEPYSQVAEKVK